MAEQLIWNLTVRAEGGPQLTAADAIDVDAYDKVSVLIPKGGGDFIVELGPGAADRITCLVILPAKLSAKLSYKVGAKAITLDQPTFLFGGGVALTGNPQSLTFNNTDAEDAAVQILIGRDATP